MPERLKLAAGKKVRKRIIDAAMVGIRRFDLRGQATCRGERHFRALFGCFLRHAAFLKEFNPSNRFISFSADAA